jgi:hypothetical protein
VTATMEATPHSALPQAVRFPTPWQSDLPLRSSTRPGHLFIRLDRPTEDCPLSGLQALDTTECLIDCRCLPRPLLRYHRYVVCTRPTHWRPATRQSHSRGRPACTPAVADSHIACSRPLRDIPQVGLYLRVLRATRTDGILGGYPGLPPGQVIETNNTLTHPTGPEYQLVVGEGRSPRSPRCQERPS